jgi:repressor LexA
MKRLSAKQTEIYNFIADFAQEEGYPPSVREICAAVGLRSPSTVHSHLKALQQAGMIVKNEHKTRAINVNGPNSPSMPQGIPILGYVAAGQPILAEQNIEGYLSYDMGNTADDCFALRVKGESMINAGILDGDLVVVKSQHTAENGQIVVAMIDGEATVKRLKRGASQIWLMPENPDYDPIDGTRSQILGTVRAVVREY